MSAGQQSDASGLRTLAEIEDLVHEAAGLASIETNADRFYRELLDRSVRAASAAGGALWVRLADGQFTLQHEIGLSGIGLIDTQVAQAAHSRLLQSTIDAGTPRTVLPHSGELSGSEAVNPSGLVLQICPQTISTGEALVMELFQPASISPLMQRGAEKILATMCGYANDFHRNTEMRSLESRESAWRVESKFTKAVHRSRSVLEAAYTIVNDGRSLVNCDRLSVVRSDGNSQVLAVSNVDSPDRRSNALRRLESLATLVLQSGEPLRYRGDKPQELPPQVDSLLDQYVDEQNVRQLQIEPLGSTNEDGTVELIGALVIEDFSISTDADRPRRIHELCDHASIALANAFANETNWWGRLLGRGHAKRTLAIGLAVAAVLVVIGLIPVEFTVSARGELQPMERHEIFAPMDAEISNISVRHNQNVARNDGLAVLHSHQLDRDFQQLLGDQDTTQKKIEALESLRVSSRPNGGGEDPFAAQRIAAEILELQAHMDSLSKQLETLREQRARLQLRSPIAGQVVTWEVERLLEGRPVRRGQALMTVVNTEGPWVAELKVPDNKIRHVLRSGNDGEQPVRFILASNPNANHKGTVREIASSVAVDRDNRPYVRLTANVERESLADPQPGTSVVARVGCGNRPLAYVLTHEIIETVGTWLFF